MGIVTCEDGQVRHPKPFASTAEADQFAEWGHRCTNRHTFTDTRQDINDPDR